MQYPTMKTRERWRLRADEVRSVPRGTQRTTWVAQFIDKITGHKLVSERPYASSDVAKLAALTAVAEYLRFEDRIRAMLAMFQSNGIGGHRWFAR